MADTIRKNYREASGLTAKDCLDFGERPSTPPEIRKYRKSATLAPGARYIHHGTAADYASKNLGELTFGEQSERGANSAADLLNHHRIGELERINKEKAERIYHSNIREPLGRTIDRKMILPAKFTEGNNSCLFLFVFL
jgi:EF-hand domain-containing family member B